MASFSIPTDMQIPYEFGHGMELIIDAKPLGADDVLIVKLLESGEVRIGIIASPGSGFTFYLASKPVRNYNIKLS